MRAALVLAAAWAMGSGCARLDGHMYLGERTDHYVLDPVGPTPDETVSPDRIERVTLATDDGLSLGAAYVKAEQQPPRAYVLLFHGRNDHLDGHFNRTKRWSNLGYDVLVFDYRGFGTSTNVDPTEAGLEHDSRAAYAYLASRMGGASPRRLVYYGHSLGTATAAQRAALTPPEALVLESGFVSVEHDKTDSTRLDLPYGFYARDPWDTESRLRGLHAPLLLLHGRDDQVMRPEFSEQLYSAANDPRLLVLVDGAGHDDVPQVMGADYARVVGGFIETHVP